MYCVRVFPFPTAHTHSHRTAKCHKNAFGAGENWWKKISISANRSARRRCCRWCETGRNKLISNKLSMNYCSLPCWPLQSLAVWWLVCQLKLSLTLPKTEDIWQWMHVVDAEMTVTRDTIYFAYLFIQDSRAAVGIVAIRSDVAVHWIFAQVSIADFMSRFCQCTKCAPCAGGVCVPSSAMMRI